MKAVVKKIVFEVIEIPDEIASEFQEAVTNHEVTDGADIFDFLCEKGVEPEVAELKDESYYPAPMEPVGKLLELYDNTDNRIW